MADQKTGVIENVVTRGSEDKPMYSFVIDKVWYGSGPKFPGKKGDEIEFTAWKQDNGYWAAKNIKATGNKAAVTGGVSGGTASGKTQEEKDFWKRKEARDVANDKHYKSRWAVSQGVEIAFKAAAGGLVKFPEKANEEKKREQTLTLGYELANILLEKANSLAGQTKEATVDVVKPTNKPAPTKEVEDDGNPDPAGTDEDWNENE